MQGRPTEVPESRHRPLCNVSFFRAAIIIGLFFFGGLLFLPLLQAQEPAANRIYFGSTGQSEPVQAPFAEPSQAPAPLHALSNGLGVPAEPVSNPFAMLNREKQAEEGEGTAEGNAELNPIQTVSGTSEANQTEKTDRINRSGGTVRGQTGVITAEISATIADPGLVSAVPKPAPAPQPMPQPTPLPKAPPESPIPLAAIQPNHGQPASADRVVDGKEEHVHEGFTDMAVSPAVAERDRDVGPEKTAAKEEAVDETEKILADAEDEQEDGILDRAVFGEKKPRDKRILTEKSGFQPILATFGGLLIVLACFFTFVLILRSVTPKSTHTLPKEAAEHLGRISLTGKVQLHLLRIGNRLVLLSVTSEGASAITELTDADEVVQVLGACRRADGQGSTAAFQQVLNGFLPKQERSDKRPNSGLNDMYTPATEESLTSLLATGLAKGK